MARLRNRLEYNKFVKWGHESKEKQRVILFEDVVVIYTEGMRGTGSIWFKRFPIDTLYKTDKKFCPFVFKGKIERIRKRGW
jgi:hypothetical protein